MTNLTRKFQQLVADANVDDSVRIGGVGKKQKVEDWLIRDSFMAECKELYAFVQDLQNNLNGMIKMTHGAGKRANLAISADDNELEEFDVEFRLQLQKNVNKYRQLEQYETRRTQLIDDQLNTLSGNLAGWFHGDQKLIKQYHLLNNKFRNGVLNSLNLIIHDLSNKFARLQQERLENKRKLDTLQFLQDGSAMLDTAMIESNPISTVNSNEMLNLNSNSKSGSNLSVNLVNVSPTITTTNEMGNVTDEVKEYEEIMSFLSQEQIQILETEHQELLNQKDQQLKDVQKINNTLMDIMSIQNELSQHLQVQSQNVNNMLDNQDEIEMNIEKGNKQLNSAKRKASRTAMWTKWLAILLTIIILWFDFIN